MKLTISKVNEVYIRVDCEVDIAYELNDYFTFDVPNAKFTPTYKNKLWDGKIRLFNIMSRRIYAGLRQQVEHFAKTREYVVEYADESFLDAPFDDEQARQSFSKFVHAPNIELRDYQLETFAHAVRTRRALFVSPTASGKSMMIFLTCMQLYEPGKKILVIVPTTSLVHQMATDFGDYARRDPNTFVHRILSGADKETDLPVIVSTWQSIYKLSPSWFSKFNVVIGDEAHLFKAKSLTDIMSKMPGCRYRFGFTGTLDGTDTHRLVLEGLFGPVKKVTTTTKLIENNTLSKFKIKALVIGYDNDTRKLVSSSTYQDEISFLVSHNPRQKLLVNLASSLKGNTLILFKMIDHGKQIYNMLQDKDSVRPLYYVDGTIDGSIREDVRKTIEGLDDGIIVASLGTFSTGINIRNLHNVIFASPSKSRIKVLQSIGRGLRKSQHKDIFTLYDIADDLTWKSKQNYTILHFIERVKMYNEEKFDYKIFNVGL